MRTTSVYGEMELFGNIFPLFPTFSQFKLPTMGGHMGPPLRTDGEGLQGRESSGGLAACGAEWPRPFPMSCTISLLRCRGGPMCPPGGNTFCFPPSGANTYHPRPGVLVFVIFLILLQYFYKYKGQRHKNFLHTPIRRKHPPWANPWGMFPTERKQL